LADLTRVKPICCAFARFYAAFLDGEWSSDTAICDHADSPFCLCYAGSNARELTSDFNTDAFWGSSDFLVGQRAYGRGEKGF
jgi:hypothetical protein